MISAKIIKDSISKAGRRLTTFELEYPRFIHSEFMTHKMVSKNSSSSRAIPINTMIKMVWNDMAEPVHWGKHQKGMGTTEELRGIKKYLVRKIWRTSGKIACGFAWGLSKLDCVKQIANRILEPWSHIKVVATAVDGEGWDNFYNLRYHTQAQPEIKTLAELMDNAKEASVPQLLYEGEWHLPYIETEIIDENLWEKLLDGGSYPRQILYHSGGNLLDLETAKKLSGSLCAQTSYRKSNEDITTANRIYDKLIISKPVHASPFEHQGTPLDDPNEVSGNFRGWHQLRQDIDGNVCKKFIKGVSNV